MADTRWLNMTKEQRTEHSKERRKIRCPRCNNFWTGLRACHCGSCHRSFSGITAFDMHRDGKHTDSHGNGSRHCVDPATLVDEKTGEALLVLTQKNDWECWSQPGTYDGPYEEGE